MPATQGGAGLIEVTIALLLLSVGALGLGRMQITAKRLGFEAIQRAEAAELANDLFERLRANRAALADYAGGSTAAIEGAPAPVPAADCHLNPCTAGQLQAWDRWQWERALSGATSAGSAGGLVDARACVAVDGQLVTVGLVWRGQGSEAAPTLDSDCAPQATGDRTQWLRMSAWIGGR